MDKHSSRSRVKRSDSFLELLANLQAPFIRRRGPALLLPDAPHADSMRAAGDQASVMTDKSDYSPGEEALITATGFRPGDTITFAIADDPNDPGDDGDADTYAPFSVTDGGADDLDGKVNGAVVTRWRIPTDNNGSGTGTPDALNATLQLTATGTDGKVATTTFTDAGSITLTGVFVTHDETAELQNAKASKDGFDSSNSDEDDNDTSLPLPTAFSTRLTQLGAGTPIGAALSGFDGTEGSDLIQISPGSLVPSLAFVLDGDGVSSGLTTLAGAPVKLYIDSSDAHIVFGRAASVDGPVVAAFYLDESKDLGGNIIGAKVWSVQYQSLQHADSSNPDDPITLAANVLRVGGAVSVVPFNLAGAPSGQNLFLTIGTPGVAIVATGKNPANQSDTGTIVGGDTINTSQAAGATTIGVNNQMIDPIIKKGGVTTLNEGLYFTYVTGAKPDYTVGTAAASLTQTEADVEANIQFSGFFAARTASFAVVQLQGGDSAVVRLTASRVDVDSAESTAGVNYVVPTANGRAVLNGTEPVPIASVSVLDASGRPVVSGIQVEIVGGIAVISGVKAGYRIRYTTDASVTSGIETHNRLLIENAGSGSGKSSASFDVGSIELETVSLLTPVDISEKLRFEDDGPTTTTAIDTLQLDEDDLPASRGTGESAGSDPSPEPLSVSGSITDNVSWGADGFGSVSKVVIGTGTDAVELAMPQTSGSDAVTVYFNSAGERQADAGNAAASLVVKEDGSYVFSLLDNLVVSGAAENIAQLLNDAGVVVYGVDGDGDEIAGGVAIKMNVVDDIPTTTTAIDTLQLDEDDLPASRGTGESAGSDPSPEPLSVSGSITDNVSWGADGFGSVSKVVIGTGTDAVELAMPQTSGSDAVTVYFNSAGERQADAGNAAASLVVKEDGSYVFSLLDNLVVSGSAENIAQLLNDAGVVVYGVDGDGDEIAGGVTIKMNVVDDIPTTTTAIDTLQLDEDDLPASRGTGESAGSDPSPEPLSVSGSITDNVSWGADGFGSVSKVVIGTGTDAVELAMPQTSGSDAVTVYFNSAGERQADAGNAAASLVVKEDGSYVFSLLDNLVVSGSAENIAQLLNDAGVVVYGMDGDGDEIAGGVTIKMNVVDDIPTDFNIGNIVGFSNSTTPQVGQWSLAPGADGVSDIAIVALDQNGVASDGIQFKITYYDETFAYATVSSFAETGLSSNVWKGTLTGDFDKDGSTAPTAVDFTLTLLANGAYTVQLAKPIESISIISTSTGKLSAGGPDISQTLTYAGTTASINFFGVRGDTSAGEALTASLTGASDYTEAEIEARSAPGSGGNTTGGPGTGGDGSFGFITANTEMNVSTSGIGVENNNFDGSGAGVQAADESFVVNPNFAFKSFSVVIDNSLGGYNAASESLFYRIIYVNGTTSGELRKVLATDLVGGAGGTQVWNYSDTRDIDSIQLVMAEGSVKINAISFASSSAFDAPDVSMAFNATATDGDGDSAADAFAVELQGAPASNPPVYSYTPTAGADVFNVQSAAPSVYNIKAGFGVDDLIYAGSVGPAYVDIVYDSVTGDTTVKIGASSTSFSTVIVSDYQFTSSQLRFFVAPIVIDLGPAGIDYMAASQGVEVELSGYAFSMAWLGSNDGLLAYDCNQDGLISDLREYAFTLWAPGAETDMQALALVFDTNNDGIFDRKDDAWRDFGIWQDLNSDGVQQSGEFKDLAFWGVQSIALGYSSDSQAYLAAGGDVQVYGQMAVVYDDGSIGVAEDVAFAAQGGATATQIPEYEEGFPVVEQDSLTSSATTPVTACSPGPTSAVDSITGAEDASPLACDVCSAMLRDALIDSEAMGERLVDPHGLAASIREVIGEDAWCVGMAVASAALEVLGDAGCVGGDPADCRCGFGWTAANWPDPLQAAPAPLLI